MHLRGCERRRKTLSLLSLGMGRRLMCGNCGNGHDAYSTEQGAWSGEKRTKRGGRLRNYLDGAFERGDESGGTGGGGCFCIAFGVGEFRHRCGGELDRRRADDRLGRSCFK